MVAPAGALTPLARADLAAFTSRAEAWADARDVYRELAHVQALQLAETARNAEKADEAPAEATALQSTPEELAPTTTAAPTTTTTRAPTPPPTTAAPASGDPTSSQWAALRGCEASGNYGAVSANGRYRGAYQFSQATWDWIAGMTRPSLVGVDPAAASPADQDAMALALWRQGGWSHWGSCGAQAAAS